MGKLKDFDIHVYKLGNKQHEFEFIVNEEFFSAFEGDLVDRGEVSVKIILDKRENLIELNLLFYGFLEMESDRSLREFKFPIEVEKKVLYKYGESEEELEEDVFVITKTTQTINVAHFIYETIALQVPLKKLHPDELEDENDEYIYIDDADEQEEDEEKEMDPRWAALKNLNKGNKN